MKDISDIIEELPSDYHRYCLYKYMHDRVSPANKHWLDCMDIPGIIRSINNRPIDVRLIRDPGVLVRFFPEMRTLGDEVDVFNGFNYGLKRSINNALYFWGDYKEELDKFEMTNEDMKLYNEIINSIEDPVIQCAFWLYVRKQVNKNVLWFYGCGFREFNGFYLENYFPKERRLVDDIVEKLSDPRIDKLFKQMHARTVKYRDIKETPEYKEVDAGLYIEQLEALPEKFEYLTAQEIADEYGCGVHKIRYYRDIENWRRHVNHTEFEYTEEFKNKVWDCMQRMTTIETANTLGVKQRVIHDICYGKLRKASKGLWVLK